jgi:hypothetical protein
MMRSSAHYRLAGLFVLVTFLFQGGAWSFSGSGSGAFGDPYIITDVDQLQEMNDDLASYYQLGNDIDASDTVNWNNGAGFVPIGDATTALGSGFNGEGHTISGLFIDRPSTEYVGLFGKISTVTLKNVTMEMVNVTGGDFVGGLVGFSYGTVDDCRVSGEVSGQSHVGGLSGYNTDTLIENCYATVAVSGSSRVGGMVGGNYEEGEVAKSYATGDVSGSSEIGGLVGLNAVDCYVSNSYASGTVAGSLQVGGLVGRNENRVDNCYATGAVFANASVGGLVGEDMLGSYTSSYWDTQTSGTTAGVGSFATDPPGMTGKTSAEMRMEATFSDWNFLTTWTIDEGNDYPKLGFFSVSYFITTLEQLQKINFDLRGDYVLGADIDASDTSTWNDGAGFVPIGPSGLISFGGTFRGVFEGQGHTIANLFIDRPSTDRVGLFGQTSRATIRNVAVEDGSVTGQVRVGGLIGHSGTDNLVSNCSATVTVSGAEEVGGLIGRSFGAVENCCATAVVSSTGTTVGGLIGELRGTVFESYATGAVSGMEKVGGLVGKNRGGVENCYSAVMVSGTGTEVGGLIGENVGSASESYATGDVSGLSTVGGLVGISNTGGELLDCYATGAVSASATVAGLVGTVSSSMVTHCYSTGAVSGMGDEVGGFVGRDDNGTGIFISCYWDTDTAGIDGFFGSKIILAGITGRTTVQMQQQATFFGWDFSKTWIVDEGNDYPKFGVSEVAYTITTLQQLQNMNYDLDGDYVLASDIDASDTRDWNGILGFDPIGDTDNPFTGSFDGQGYTIAGLHTNRTLTDSVGLFGHSAGNSLMNVGLEDGSVSGRSAVGYLVGVLTNGTVSKCYAEGIISGSENVGGLAGLTNRSSVSNCYSSGISNGASAVGGLVGWNIGTAVTNCYSTSLILGLPTQGGLIGDNTGGSYTSCYWDNDTAFVAGGVGNETPDPSGVTGPSQIGILILFGASSKTNLTHSSREVSVPPWSSTKTQRRPIPPPPCRLFSM